MLGDIFYPGDIIQVLDRIDLETKTIATIKAIEQDHEIEGLFYLYLVANETALNDKYESKVGNYWDIITNISPYVKLLHRAVD